LGGGFRLSADTGTEAAWGIGGASGLLILLAVPDLRPTRDLSDPHVRSIPALPDGEPRKASQRNARAAAVLAINAKAAAGLARPAMPVLLERARRASFRRDCRRDGEHARGGDRWGASIG